VHRTHHMQLPGGIRDGGGTAITQFVMDQNENAADN